jgi:hypothetical protein
MYSPVLNPFAGPNVLFIFEHSSGLARSISLIDGSGKEGFISFNAKGQLQSGYSFGQFKLLTGPQILTQSISLVIVVVVLNLEGKTILES